jgi:hypothetical protein
VPSPSRAPPLVFISYRTSDTKAQATRLAEALKRELAVGTVFLDRFTVEGGETWTATIRDAVERADAVLFLIGPN